jgi:hypothetical protein
MRFEAAQAAGEMGLKPAVQLLIRMVDDPDSIVREAAVAALGKIGGAQARRALEFLARSDDEALAQAADDALAELRFISDVPEGADATARAPRDDDDDEDEDEFDDHDFADYDDGFGDGDDYDDEYDEDDEADWDEIVDEEEDGEDEAGFDDDDL